MKMLSIEEELRNNSYPGRGIIIGKTPDGKKAVTAYFIMGRSENSRNRIFVEDGEGIRTQAFDPESRVTHSQVLYADWTRDNTGNNTPVYVLAIFAAAVIGTVAVLFVNSRR